MRRRAARATHLALWLVGALLYVVFVIPRWWVLTGDIPATAATFGRIVTGFPIAAAAVPVGLSLQRALKQESRIPELALRLRAWSAVLHVIAGVFIIATAVAEIWLNSQAAAPWLFGVYGGAGSLAVLAALAFVLSFPAELPPPPPKPAKAKPEKKTDKTPKQRRTRKRGRKQTESEPESGQESDREAESSDGEAKDTAGDEADTAEASDAESVAPADDAPASEANPESTADSIEPAEDTAADTEASSAVSDSGIQRPVGKKRHRLRR
ncbi:MAG TPA: hypothetical protein PLD01_16280 [Mycobacterium sp.]|nr:hypothetical protein [Mycobacterium sp.]